MIHAKAADEKTCSICGRLLPIEKFYRNAGCRDGRFSHCADCHMAQYRRDYAEAGTSTRRALEAAEYERAMPSAMQVERDTERLLRKIVNAANCGGDCLSAQSLAREYEALGSVEGVIEALKALQAQALIIIRPGGFGGLLRVTGHRARIRAADDWQTPLVVELPESLLRRAEEAAA